MKVLLIVPTMRYTDPATTLLSMSDFPTGLAYIAASLKEAGHEVYGLNLNNDTRFANKLLMLTNRITQALDQYKPELIGIGGICIDYACIRDVIEIIRAVVNTPIVLGGGIVNNDAEYIFKLLKPDYAVIGEGEETAVRLTNALESKTPFDFPNLCYWKDGGAVFNPVSHTYRDVDQRPFPDYEPFGIQDMLDNYSEATRVLYRYTRVYPRPMVVVTARGCPFNCTFCVHRGGPKYRARSIENIMEEIRVYYERYQFNILIIVDELFAVNKERMREFCEAILTGKEKYDWDFDWMFQTHANAKLDKEVLELGKKAGCYLFSYGMESTSPRVLKSMNKKTKIPQLIEAIKMAEECNIGFGGNLIFGDPVEDETTIDETLQFYAHYCQNSFVFLGIVMPYPGSQLFDYCIQHGLIPNKRQFYETIDAKLYNMTSMPDNLFMRYVDFLNMLERSWLWVKTVDAIRVEELPIKSNYGKVYEVEAICPHCGESVTYGQALQSSSRFIGVGCTKCSKRIRINLEVPCPSTNTDVRDAVLTSTR